MSVRTLLCAYAHACRKDVRCGEGAMKSLSDICSAVKQAGLSRSHWHAARWLLHARQRCILADGRCIVYIYRSFLPADPAGADHLKARCPGTPPPPLVLPFHLPRCCRGRCRSSFSLSYPIPLTPSKPLESPHATDPFAEYSAKGFAKLCLRHPVSHGRSGQRGRSGRVAHAALLARRSARPPTRHEYSSVPLFCPPARHEYSSVPLFCPPARHEYSSVPLFCPPARQPLLPCARQPASEKLSLRDFVEAVVRIAPLVASSPLVHEQLGEFLARCAPARARARAVCVCARLGAAAWLSARPGVCVRSAACMRLTVCTRV
jgi:hypothetical protein